FIRAMRAEGVPCGEGYGPLNKADFIRDAIHSRHYAKVYGKAAIDEWAARNECPENDKLCAEGLWFSQTQLLAPRTDMDEIAAAVRKIHAYAGDLAKA
ncbi:MAG: hypothetical protein KJZ87_05920, partial [Thermoguttaceae bacterium]|nr:hypothetical protein [Thermoguttaceae bacterium]